MMRDRRLALVITEQKLGGGRGFQENYGRRAKRSNKAVDDDGDRGSFPTLNFPIIQKIWKLNILSSLIRSIPLGTKHGIL